MSGILSEETKGCEEVDFRLGVLLKEGLDAVIDSAALCLQFGLVVVVIDSIVLPCSAFFCSGVVVCGSPQNVNIVYPGSVNLLLEGLTPVICESCSSYSVGGHFGAQKVSPDLLCGVRLGIDGERAPENRYALSEVLMSRINGNGTG